MLSTPNSVSQKIKNGRITTGRYYDPKGKAYLDIDYTNHGDSATHSTVPHQHIITLDKNGKSM